MIRLPLDSFSSGSTAYSDATENSHEYDNTIMSSIIQINKKITSIIHSLSHHLYHIEKSEIVHFHDSPTRLRGYPVDSSCSENMSLNDDLICIIYPCSDKLHPMNLYLNMRCLHCWLQPTTCSSYPSSHFLCTRPDSLHRWARWHHM